MGDNEQVSIRPERTAMQRHSCSRPIAVALADGVISQSTTVFDYGCGHGADVRYMKARKMKASGWDPHHAPKSKVAPAHVVNLGYVLNVIEDPNERRKALSRAFELAEEALVVSVRVDKVPNTFTEYGDGHLSKRDTFQKLYSQSEFRDYVEDVLGLRTHAASIGVAYVFKNEQAETRFVANRAFTRRLEYRTDLIEEFGKNTTAKKLVRLANKLGRIPHPDEFKQYGQLELAFGSRQRIERLVLHRINPKAFEGSREQRREDVLTYLAMIRLQGLKQPKYGDLRDSVRRDIKAIWGSYERARDESHEFLFSLGKPEVVRKVCRSAGVGKLLPEDLYVHRSAEDDLPALLRILLFAVKRIVGTISHDLTKISLDGRAVSLLTYREFDESPHPELVESLRVYLPKASYKIRSYGTSANPPILHRKETFVTESYAYHERFSALTIQEDQAGLLSASDIGRRNEWEALLSGRELTIVDHELVSTTT